MYPHRKKSQGVRSGDLGGQSRWCSNLFERPCIYIYIYIYIYICASGIKLWNYVTSKFGGTPFWGRTALIIDYLYYWRLLPSSWLSESWVGVISYMQSSAKVTLYVELVASSVRWLLHRSVCCLTCRLTAYNSTVIPDVLTVLHIPKTYRLFISED